MGLNKKRVVFMNGGKHFWNREKEIIKELTEYFEIFLLINHSKDINYSIDDIIDFCLKNGITLRIIDYTNRRTRNILKAISDFHTVLAIKKFKADVIFIESFGSPYFALFSGLLLNHKKTIFSIMDYKLHQYRENQYKLSEKIYQHIYLNFFKNFHLFSSEQSRMMKEDYPEFNIFHIKLFLITNDFLVVNPRIERGSDFINFLFFGKIHYYKGVDILIKAGNILSKCKKNFKITIAGKCTDFSYYEHLIETNNHFDLQIRHMKKEEIPELFSRSDYLVLPYREVTQSGPLMIAYNFGIVPIVSDLGGFKELVADNENGFVFKNGSAEELAQKMKYILDLNFDERRKIKDSLRKYVTDEYDINKFTRQYKQMFESVIATS